MKLWPGAWALKPGERGVLLVLCAAALAALSVRCRQLRNEQPDFTEPPEGVEAPDAEDRGRIPVSPGAS